MPSGCKQPCLAIDKRTGAVVGRDPSIADAGRALGMTRCSALSMCSHRTLGTKSVFLRTDWDGHEDVTGKSNRPVRCVSDDGEERWYLTTKDAASGLGCVVSSVRQSAIGMLPPLRNKWRIEFVNQIGTAPDEAKGAPDA